MSILPDVLEPNLRVVCVWTRSAAAAPFEGRRRLAAALEAVRAA